jgi:hypothetical protein
MHEHFLWLVPFFLFLSPLGAQTPVPAASYKLHAEKESYSPSRPSALLHLLPDQALLVLIPQPEHKWLLKRLTAWDASNPKEETLAFDSQTPSDGDSWYEDIKVNPAATYAVIRLQSFTRNENTTPLNSTAFFVLVDLRSFTIASKRSTTDPLIAASNWSFVKTGMLIASAMTGRTMTPTKPKNGRSYETITDSYEAAALTLPDFTPTMRCRYTLFLDHRAGSTRSDRYLSKEDGCAPLVAIAGVPSAENLPDGPPRPIPYAALAGPTCDLGDESPSGDFALYGCRTGHDYMDGMIVTTDSRNLTILAIPEGKPTLSVPLPHNLKPYPALLANANGHTWLLLLRDGIKLETYRIP